MFTRTIGSLGMRRTIAVVGGLLLVAAELMVSERTLLAAVGDITEYPVPTAGGGPASIAAGPDGNLWFTEINANNVVKVTTSGSFTEYSVPTANSSPAGIAAGPDGNLWFTENRANQIAKVTTSGTFTEYSVPTANSGPNLIAAGPDGNLWFTESAANQVAKVTTSGTFTEYPIPTAVSSPLGIAAGPDGNLWFVEFNANQVAKITTSGAVTEYSIPSANTEPEGIAAGPDGNLWFTAPAGLGGTDHVGKITTAGAITEYALPTPTSVPVFIAAGPDGNVWFTEQYTNKVAKVTTLGVFTEYPIPTGNSAPTGIIAGPDGYIWFTEILANKVAKVVTATPQCRNATTTPATGTARSTKQYTLANSDGVTWQDVDTDNLSLSCTASANQTTFLTANADLWTANAGFNQDLGIFVSDNGGADQLLAWKESGGFAGTFSPNAAYVQTAYNEVSGHHYVFKLKWKTNKPASGATIFIGAGPIGGLYSPTSLVAETFPTGVVPNSARSTMQYTLASSDGSTWQTIDATNLSTTLSPGANSTAVLGGNADLWTANAGYNQDLGIFVSDNGAADTLVAWKESGGFAGTFSPNAAFVKTTYAMTGGHSYAFKLKWKTNKPASGATIFVGAGPIGGLYSPTSLLAQTIAASANPYAAVSTSQYSLSNSDGTTWQLIDAGLNVTVTPGADTNSILGANADLWTANAGYNQDIGIFVSDNAGADTLVAWKESGGFAGTFSPNAAFAQATYPMTSGHTYVFKLKWKTNRSASGASIYGAAGGPAPYSPTRLTVELTT